MTRERAPAASFKTLPGGIPVLFYDTLGSTNDEARRLSDAGEKEPLWVVARTQSGGRGRRGRQWASPEGNLYATLLLTPGSAAGDAGAYTFIASLAVYDALEDFGVDRERLALKWPNDPLIGGAKAGGILLEGAGPAGGPLDRLAIGIGINLVSHPEGTPYPATDVKAETGHAPTVEEALSALSSAFARWEGTWRSEGFAAVRAAWLERAAGRGAAITVRLPGETLEGVFDDLEADGALRLALSGGGVRRVRAGDVFFGSLR